MKSSRLRASSLRRTISIQATVGSLLVIVVGGISFWSIGRYAAAAAARRQHYDVRVELARLFQAVEDAETAQRGYLLTSASSYLEPGREAPARIGVARDSLRKLLASDSAQLPALDQVIALALARLAQLDTTIALHRAGNHEAAMRLVNSGKGKAVMDSLRAVVDAMARTEELQTAVTDSRLGRHRAFAAGAIVASAFIGLAFLIPVSVAMHREVAARRVTMRALQAAEERSRLLLSSAGGGLYGVDLDDRCTFINDEGARLLGYLPSQLVGKPIHDVIHHHHEDGTPYASTDCPILRAARACERARVDDEVFWRRDGTAVHVDYSSHPIENDEGATVGAVVTFQDITRRRDLERLRDNLVHMLVHDLRSPLAAMRLNLEMMEMDIPDEQTELRQSIHDARGAAQLLGDMVGDVLDVSRMEAGSMPLRKRPTDLRGVTNEAIGSVEALAGGGDLRLEPGEAVVIDCDGDVIRRVMVNLVANAIKFTTEGGSGCGSRPSLAAPRSL